MIANMTRTDRAQRLACQMTRTAETDPETLIVMRTLSRWWRERKAKEAQRQRFKEFRAAQRAHN